MNKIILYNVVDNDPQFESQIQEDLKDLLGFQDYRIVTGKKSEKYYTIFAFLSEWEVPQLTRIFKKYEMLIECKDVTYDAIMGKFPGSDYENCFDFVTDRKLLNDFINQNMTVDHVLDKISESGIESITKFQKEILKKF